MSWRNGIEIPINEPLIQKYIRFYRGEGRTTFSEAMEKAKKCLPRMTEILESQGVPAEMVSIVFVESRFEKSASYRGAGGYWQMMAATARNMGLRVDRSVDERRDPIKSTKAAAKYLKTLYEQYDSWLLALAAYNAGSRPINCVARKCCVKDGELYGRRLPAHSAVYVSKVLAAMNIMRRAGKVWVRVSQLLQAYGLRSCFSQYASETGGGGTMDRCTGQSFTGTQPVTASGCDVPRFRICTAFTPGLERKIRPRLRGNTSEVNL